MSHILTWLCIAAWAANELHVPWLSSFSTVDHGASAYHERKWIWGGKSSFIRDRKYRRPSNRRAWHIPTFEFRTHRKALVLGLRQGLLICVAAEATPCTAHILVPVWLVPRSFQVAVLAQKSQASQTHPIVGARSIWVSLWRLVQWCDVDGLPRGGEGEWSRIFTEVCMYYIVVVLMLVWAFVCVSVRACELELFQKELSKN